MIIFDVLFMWAICGPFIVDFIINGDSDEVR